MVVKGLASGGLAVFGGLRFDYLVVFVGWWRCVYHVMILTL